MSVVVFFTPAHAAPAASAHASAIPLIVLVLIMVAPAIAWVDAPVVNRGNPLQFANAGPSRLTKLN
jgi:hypothetical protein